MYKTVKSLTLSLEANSEILACHLIAALVAKNEPAHV